MNVKIELNYNMSHVTFITCTQWMMKSIQKQFQHLIQNKEKNKLVGCQTRDGFLNRFSTKVCFSFATTELVIASLVIVKTILKLFSKLSLVYIKTKIE